MTVSKIALIAGLTAVFFCGCQREDDFSVSAEVLTLATRSAVPFPTNAPVRIEQMASNAVIVAVNGVPLTKATYDDLMMLKLKSLMSRKGMDQYTASEMMDQYKVQYVKSFVVQRLLCDEAFGQGVVTTNEILKAVADKIRAAAKKAGKTPQQYVTAQGEAGKYAMYELGVSYAMDKLIHKKIPPVAVVDDELMAAVKKQVSEENSRATATNAAIKARMEDWKRQLLAKGLDFRKAAASFAMQNPTNENAGVWGEFEEGEMDDPTVQAAVFALPESGISEVLEDDNGYHLVKVLKVIAPEKNEAGRVIRRERRVLSEIYVEKVPMLIAQSDIALSADLKSQMQMQAVDDYVTRLSTNGVNRIEYPNGKALFR